VRRESNVMIPQYLVSRITEEADSAFVGSLRDMDSPLAHKKIRSLLFLYYMRNPKIGYNHGLAQLLAVILRVNSDEAEALVIFSFLIEHVFPSSYFSSRHRNYHRQVENYSFALMARCHLKNYVRLYTHTDDGDQYPYFVALQNLAEEAFSTLFSTVLPFHQTLKIWDWIFVHGFSLVRRILLLILESNSKRASTKFSTYSKKWANGGAMTLDQQLILANSAKRIAFKEIKDKKFNQALELAKMDSDNLVYACDKHLREASAMVNELEKRANRRLQTLSQAVKAGAHIPSMKILFSEIDVNLGVLVSFAGFEQFCSNKNFPADLPIQLFATLDLKGNSQIDSLKLKTSMALCSSSDTLAEKIGHCFEAIDKGNHGRVECFDLMRLIKTIESILDERSTYFDMKSREIFEVFEQDVSGSVSQKNFVRRFLNEDIFEPLRSLIDYMDRKRDEHKDSRTETESDQTYPSSMDKFRPRDIAIASFIDSFEWKTSFMESTEIEEDVHRFLPMLREVEVHGSKLLWERKKEFQMKSMFPSFAFREYEEFDLPSEEDEGTLYDSDSSTVDTSHINRVLVRSTNEVVSMSRLASPTGTIRDSGYDM